MKQLKQLCLAVLLTFAFTFSAFAEDGHIPCGITSAPPAESTVATSDGEIECGLAQAALAIIQSVLSLS